MRQQTPYRVGVTKIYCFDSVDLLRGRQPYILRFLSMTFDDSYKPHSAVDNSKSVPKMSERTVVRATQSLLDRSHCW
jgi:hypothetical protein